MIPILQEVKRGFSDLVTQHQLGNQRVKVTVEPLSPKQAIGSPSRQGFGIHNVRCTDLNPKNIGSYKFGIEIGDGATETLNLINWCDLLLVTSSAIANGTFDNIRKESVSAGKRLILFGITGAGVCTLTGLERICPFGH